MEEAEETLLKASQILYPANDSISTYAFMTGVNLHYEPLHDNTLQRTDCCRLSNGLGGWSFVKRPENFFSAIADNIGVNRAVLALSVGRLGDAVGNSILFIVVPLYVAKLPSPAFPLPETVRAGILISLFGFVNAVAQPVAGALIDRINRRKPFVLGGLLLLGAATAAYTFASRYSYLLIFRVLQGIGVAAAIPATLALLANSTRQESRGGAMGVFSTFRVAGLAVGPLIGGFLNDHYGFDTTFYVGAAFTLVGVALVQLWVREIRAEKPPQEGQPFQIIDSNLLSGAILSLGFGTLVMAISFTLIVPLEQQFNMHLNETATAFGIAFSALMIARILIQIPLGRVSDRLGRRPLIIVGLILMAVATAPMGLIRTTGELVGLRVLQGVASACIAAPVFALAGDLSSSGGEGRQMSIVTMGFGLGIALGTLSAGLLAVYSLALPFYLGACLSLLAAWVIHRNVPETVHRNSE
jgi:MFS family permease